VLREPLEIDGVPLVLVDTAGLHAAGDAIERIGMERTRAEMARADVLLAVSDASAPRDALPGPPVPGHRIDVYNKVDLVPGFAAPGAAIAVSAKTGTGLDALRQAIVRAAGWAGSGETVFLARERHLRALEGARVRLEAAASTAQSELLAEELRLAQAALAEITGEVTADELLGEIFARFCIGK
jgi:tRNA modification GTPase